VFDAESLSIEALKGRYIPPFQGFGYSVLFPQGFALCYWIKGFLP
jgi:hypothetical protein